VDRPSPRSRHRLVRLAVAALTACSLLPAAATAAHATDNPAADNPAVDAAATTPSLAAVVADPDGGHWRIGVDGHVESVGGASDHGTLRAITLSAPIVDGVASPTGDGLWLAGADGAIYAFGDAPFVGRVPRPAASIVSIAATPTGRGLWLAGRDGGVFALGDAHFHGSAAGISNRPIVELIPSPAADGYLLVADDGGAFAFGGKHFPGSLGGLRLNAPIVAAIGTPSGRGVTMLGADGGVFALGDAPGDAAQPAPSGRRSADVARTSDGTLVTITNALPATPVSITTPGTRSGRALPANSGSGRRIVYSVGQQHVWLVEADGTIARDYAVSGRAGTPRAGAYSVQSKSRWTSSSSDSRVSMEYMVRFRGGIGFHTIPRRGGQPLQTEDQLGTPLSAGCVRQATPDAIFLWEWAPVGTPVMVL
jgi:hypothetical protein